MALAAATVFEINGSATASNVNGGGFNPANASMLADLTTDANTANTNSPVVSSASYNFVAGDAGKHLYIQQGTNWTPGWYPIASVAANKATLSAAVGQAVQVNNNLYGPNTVAGCATVGTPTGGTFTIDYSQATTAIYAPTDLTSVGGSTTLTSAAAGFTPVMVGNLLHQTTTGTGGFGLTQWFEIVTYVNATTVTTDRTTNNGTAEVAVTGRVGGALSLGSSDDAVFELGVAATTAGARYFAKSGTYTLGGTVNIAANGAAAWPFILEGYATMRGDRPTGSTRPLFVCGSGAFTLPSTWAVISMRFTGTASPVVEGNASKILNCVAINTSATTGRPAFRFGGGSGLIQGSEAISYRGQGITLAGSACRVINNYVHDCGSIGINSAFGSGIISGNIVASCVTKAIDIGASPVTITNNTLYGAENKLGLGIDIPTNIQGITVMNNIIYGFTTGINVADVGTSHLDANNNFYNNTSDVSAATKWQKQISDTALDPQFVSVVQRADTTATTTSGNHLVQSGATFQTWAITPGIDYLYVVSGTGVTAGVYGIASVDSETQITTDVTLSADATANKVWQIRQGGNFAIGTNLKAAGFPGVFPGGLTTGYMDIGAAQRQEAASGGIIASRIFTGY